MGKTKSSDGGTTGGSPRESLFGMLNAYVISQSLYVAAKLGIADKLADGPKSTDDLAASTEAHAPSLYRILRTLASEGVFAELDGNRFELTPMAEFLRSGIPGSLRGWAIMRGEPSLWRSWGEILHSVETGRPAFNHAFGMQAFEYFGKHPEVAAMFDDAMRSVSGQKFGAVAEAYDFSGIGTLVDVGGGNGGLMATILKANLHMKGTIAELSHVVENSRKRIDADGLIDRCECVATDMFEEVPKGGDAYILANVIHDWDDERSRIILKNCHRAMSDEGRLLLVEMILSPANKPHLSKIADIEMLVMTEGGKERSEHEYAELCETAGFRLSKVIPTVSPWSIIEGVPI